MLNSNATCFAMAEIARSYFVICIPRDRIFSFEQDETMLHRGPGQLFSDVFGVCIDHVRLENFRPRNPECSVQP
jgi:hypothetical protein